MDRIKILVALLIILLIGSSLRFYELDLQSLWVDELATLRRAEVESVQNILHMATTIDIHPPGIYIIYHYWLKVFSNSETNFRLLSAIFGILAILTIFILAMRLYSHKEGLISALIVAVSWFPIYYSQEARPYALLFLCSIISTLLYWQLVKKIYLDQASKLIDTALYILSATVTIYIHYFGTYLIFLQGVFLFFIALREKKHFYKWLIIYSVIFVLYLPWLPSMIAQLQGGVGTDIYSAPNFSQLLHFFIYTNNNSKFIFGITILFSIILILNILSQKKFRFLESFKSLKVETIFLLFYLIIPLLVITLLSHLVTPVFSFKNMIIAYAPLPILISRLIVKSNFNGIIKFLFISLFVSFLIYDLIIIKQYYSKPTKEQFRDVAQYVMLEYDQEKKPDIFALSYAAEYFDYYFKNFGTSLKVNECVQLENETEEIETDLAKCQADNLWFISGHQLPDERVQNILNNKYSLDHRKTFIGAQAALYIRK